MSTFKSIKGREKDNRDGLHEMPSGLIHTADSLAGGPQGTFVDRFGPPGSPAMRAAAVRDGGVGESEQHAPALLSGLAGRRRKGL
jgi:hypothetical protein